MPDEPFDSLAAVFGGDEAGDPVAESRDRLAIEAELFGAESRDLHLGRYVLGSQLGAGATGIVYAASDPELARNVAIKIVRTQGLGVLATQELSKEARALAQIGHPNVVEVFDVGILDATHPDPALRGPGVYTVEAIVPGETMARWLATARPIPEIISAFILAGRGLAAAHQRRIIHGDFKPANVLMGEDARIVVADFGLSTMHGAEDPTNDASVCNGGTPAYMAPELHRGAAGDEHSDQYAYCVSLWEALFGRRPFGGSLDDLLPQKMAGPPDAPHRRLPTAIERALRRGLSPEPQARFDGMPALLTALQRRPPKWRSAAAVAVGGALVIGVFAGASRGTEAWLERTRAADCQSAAAALSAVWNADATSDIEQATVDADFGYLTTTWSTARAHLDEYANRWSDIRLRGCLAQEDAIANCLDRRRIHLEVAIETLRGNDAMILRAVAMTTALPSLAPCETPQRARRENDRSAAGPALPDAERRLARVVYPPTDHEHAKLEARAVLDVARRAGDAGLESRALAELADRQVRTGEFEEATQTIEAWLSLADRTGADEEAARALIEAVGLHVHGDPDLERASEYARMAEARIERVGSPAPLRLLLDHERVPLLLALGETEAAIRAAGLQIERAKALYGSSHPSLSAALNDLAMGLLAAGDLHRARSTLEHAVSIATETWGAGHPNSAMTRNNLAAVTMQMGDAEAAVDLHRALLQDRRATLRADHPDIVQSQVNLAVSLGSAGEYEAAVEQGETALLMARRVLGDEHPATAVTHRNLGDALAALGRHGEARGHLERSLVIRESVLGHDHPDVASSLSGLASLAAATGDHPGAISQFRRSLTIVHNALGDSHPDLIEILAGLGRSYVALHEDDEARQALERMMDIRSRTNHGLDTPDLDAWLQSNRASDG